MGKGTVLGEDKESEDLDKNDTGRCVRQGQHSRVSFGSGNRMLPCLYPQQVLYQVMGKENQTDQSRCVKCAGRERNIRSG